MRHPMMTTLPPELLRELHHVFRLPPRTELEVVIEELERLWLELRALAMRMERLEKSVRGRV